MSFELSSIVPWGRNLSEYIKMFSLSDSDLDSSIISFGDGPASFNAEMNNHGRRVLSIDPIYNFSREDINTRINETKNIVIDQTRRNASNFRWNSIRDINELEQIRMNAMNAFLVDFYSGKTEGRYIGHSMPERLPFAADSFDIGLSSHFLLLYSETGLNFHFDCLNEMLRLCREVRIFPILDLNAKRSHLLDDIIKEYNSRFRVKILKVDYEFQVDGNEMFVIEKY